MPQPLTIIIVTYDRPKEIRMTIAALAERMRYSGDAQWHIADDNTPGTYIQDIVRDFNNMSFTATVTDRRGWGANVNKALMHCSTDYIFLCEDDYVARSDIDIDTGIALLEKEQHLGVVRFDGIAGHVGLKMELKEANTNCGTIAYLELERKHTGHLNVYSNRPHLRHRRLHDLIGMYPENRTLGETETAYAMRVIENERCPGFAILSDGIPTAFDHIGKSRQGTNADPNWKKKR